MLEDLSSLFFPCLKTRPSLVSWYVPFLEPYCISVGGGSSFCLLARHLPTWNRPRSAGGYRNPTIKSKIRIIFIYIKTRLVEAYHSLFWAVLTFDFVC
jgi:hypothetical protein